MGDSRRGFSQHHLGMADIELTYSCGLVPRDGELPARETIATVFDELDFQTAVQAYLWAIPIVSWAQWMDVHTNIFGATASDIVVYRSYRDRLGLITANATTPYILNFFDLGATGPLVIELPPGPTAGGIADFWQREFAVLGEMGPDAGKGGKTLVVGPGQSAEDTGDYTVVHSPMMHIMFGFRTLDPDPARSDALVDAVRVYPYSDRENPSPTRLVSPDGKPWSGIQPRDLRYWELLHDIVQDEPVEERDRFPMAWLRQLGIEKGKPFAPDDRVRKILQRAVEVGEVFAQANAFVKRFPGSRYWPDRQWDLAIGLDNSAQRGDNYDEFYERASWFYEAVTFSEAMKSTTPGLGQAYLGSYADAEGHWLDGAKSYTLHVPADVPAKLFWSATVYSVDTRCLVDNEQGRGDRGSRDPDLVVNEDGSVDLYYGPTAPVGKEPNWVQTIVGQHWFSYFRFYGPLEPYFDRTWKLGDIEPA